MAFNSAALRTTAISLLLLAIVAVFLLRLPPANHPSNHISLLPHRSLLNSSCRFFSDESDGLFNYFSFHSCLFRQNPFLSVPFLGLFVLLYFYILITTAQAHFSVVVTKLVAHLRLSPSMGAVTLLALGNGAPDVFASVAAVKGGQPRTGFGAILSAGTFVSAFVVGFVSIYAAPFAVDPAPFVRDVMFYLTAAMFLFYVYLSAEIFLWQAVGFVGFYLFFVGIVFWMDLGEGNRRRGGGAEMGSVGNGKTHKRTVEMGDCENGKFLGSSEIKKNPSSGLLVAYEKISQVWELPVSILLKLTIPNTSLSEWSRFYQSANIALCPLALLFSCRSFMSFNHPVAFLLSNVHFPLWFVVLCGSSSLALLHYIVETEPPKSEQMPSILAAFVMSVFWISTAAGELLNCLAVLGVLLKLPSALLGLTVLAWGNSVGDLVADVAVAKAGQPALAMAGCFAGPMFNMLFGLGTALVIQTGNVYPEAYELRFHVSSPEILGILPCWTLLLFHVSEPGNRKVFCIMFRQRELDVMAVALSYILLAHFYCKYLCLSTLEVITYSFVSM
nr:cation/calcium exchanger 5 [Ipomoea batatas]